MTILNKKNVDYLRQPMFCGEPLALQRYDKFKHPDFFDLFDKQIKQFWRPEEISLSKDRVDYGTLQEHEKFIFTRNLLYQTTMDSVISRGADAFLSHVTNPELEACMKVWAFFETIHSYSYSYIIKNVYADPSSVLDEALTDPEIAKRAVSSAAAYDKLRQVTAGDEKANIYLGWINANILEAVRFYVSFVCAFAFAENKKMIGNADIIKLIRRDEALHYRMSQLIIHLMRTREDEGFLDIVQKYDNEVVQLYLDAAREEKQWAEYIFSRGSILGLNSQILSGYIEWLTDSRMQAIGLPKYFGTKNPIGNWLDAWMNPSAVQVAPQEKEVTSYLVGATKNDLDEMDLDGLL
jgi:ribonucleoside-diphosphate reductase beta chain